MAEDEERAPDVNYTKQDLRTMCMMQLFFKHKCMLYDDLKESCKEILKSNSGVLARGVHPVLPLCCRRLAQPFHAFN
jgi:hypothetical protein